VSLQNCIFYLVFTFIYGRKAYKNGVFLNKPTELNIAYDAAFDAGGGIDGITFITPIRELINRFPDPDTDDDFETAQYVADDQVHVEIHSIINEVFMFLQMARDQIIIVTITSSQYQLPIPGAMFLRKASTLPF
jgi:hypothetical protein